jgi:hypothetical protein
MGNATVQCKVQRDDVTQLHATLLTPPWYSYSTMWLLQALDVTAVELAGLVHGLRTRGHQVNVFDYNGVEYIGLETRRLDYERDRKNGVNHVETLIAQGHYD